MKEYLKKFVFALLGFWALTLIANHFLLLQWFLLKNEPTNPLGVNLYSIISFMVCIPVALALSFFLYKLKNRRKKQILFVTLCCTIYMIVLFIFYPIERPTPYSKDDIEITIHK